MGENSGRIYLITGAASGIGAALARLVAPGAAGLMLHTRREAGRLDSVADICRGLGCPVEVMVGDLATDDGLPDRLVAASVARFGRLDGVIANAGFPLMKSFDEGTADDISYAFGGNLISFFALAKAAHPHLTQVEGGRLVAVGSFTAHVFRTDMPQFPMSAASKGGLETAVKSLAIAMAADGITVNCVVPGYIEKDPGTGDGLPVEKLRALQGLIPLGRLGKPDDVAGTIQFLLGSAADYITGQSIHVNGGLVSP